MRTHDLITLKLTEAFRPESLRVTDESHRHEGHAGHRPGGESHFRVYIVAQAFAGKSRLERHRLVNDALSAELAGGVHALAIHATAPGEPEA
jgi:BolA protein